MIKVYAVPKDDSVKEKTKAWLHNRWIDARCFWEENKDTIIKLTPVVVGGATVMVRVIGRRMNLATEQKMKDRYVWDPKLGHYWEIRKKLSNAQWAEIERRKESGEAMGQILASMKVLKI